MADDGADDEGLLRALVQGQARSDERFNEMFRRMDKVEKSAAESLALGRDVLITLREQNALAKITEVKAEAHTLVAALRLDLVNSHKNLREALDKVDGRVTALDQLKQAGVGMARGGKLVWEAVKLLVAGGVAGALVKLFGGHGHG